LNDFAVVVPSRHPDIIQPLLDSIEQHHQKIPRVVVVQDRTDFPVPSWCEKIVVHAESFCFSRNVNLGLEAVKPADALILNDDTRIISGNFFQLLADRANAVSNFGIVCPRVKGGTANPYQRVDGPWPYGATYVELRGRKATDPFVPFICTYMKRRMLDEVGNLDENFVCGNFEDVDYCVRAKRADWKVVIFREPIVCHGDGSPGLTRGQNYSLSLSRDPDSMYNSNKNLQYFNKKYGIQGEPECSP
jgi:GT2 family glycosyltransferase